MTMIILEVDAVSNKDKLDLSSNQMLSLTPEIVETLNILQKGGMLTRVVITHSEGEELSSLPQNVLLLSFQINYEKIYFTLRKTRNNEIDCSYDSPRHHVPISVISYGSTTFVHGAKHVMSVLKQSILDDIKTYSDILKQLE